jgi:cellulose synthase (UDP-forming)
MVNAGRNVNRDQKTPPSHVTTMLLIIFAAAALLFFLYSASTYLTVYQQAWLSGIFLAAIWILRKYRIVPEEIQRIAIILLCLFLTTRYWIFRTADTLTYLGLFSFIGMILLYLAETYSNLTYVLGMFVNIFPMRREIKPVNLTEPNLPTVDVFIPTFNEPEVMVGITATAASRLDYPKDKLNVYILDDGGTVQKRNDPDPVKAKAAQSRHETLKALAEFLEIHYLTRERNLHAKAGNINEALWHQCPEEQQAALTRAECIYTGMEGSEGDLILILDCDHVPTRDFLRSTVGYFMHDEDLFLVQTPHFFINPDPVEKNLATFLEKPSENEMFYGGVHLGLDFWNASFFCGSAAVLRRSHLREVGGIAGETITEDAETALALHARGYRSAYVSRPMVCGLSPETFADFILQRSRWAQGMTQILMLKNPLFIKGLSIPQRLCYLNTCIFWFFGFSRFIFFLAPLCYLFFGLNVYNATLDQVVVYALPHILAATLLTNYMFGDLRHPFFSELYEVVQSIFNIPAVIGAVIRPRSPSFKVTPKSQSMSSDVLSPLALPFYLMLIICLAAFPFAVGRFFILPPERDAVYITLFWNTFNLGLVFLCLGAVWEKRQLRKKHRIRTDETIHFTPADTQQIFEARVYDLSEDGIGFTTVREAPLHPGDHIEISAEDSYGHRYSLPAQIRRVAAVDGHLTCGCEFLGEDGLSWMDIVTYVYGDSLRWEKFWRKRRLHRENAWRGITYLLGKGIQGSAQNFNGLFRLGWRSIHEWGVVVWKRLKPKIIDGPS